MNRTTVTVPVWWRQEWPTTGLRIGDTVRVTFDGFGMVCDVEWRDRYGRIVELPHDMEAAELDALLDAGAEGSIDMVQTDGEG